MKKIFAMILTIAMLMTAIAAIAEGQGGPMGGPQQGQMQQGPQHGDRDRQPPEKPSGDQGQQAPRKPDAAPEKPSGEKPADAPEEPEDLSGDRPEMPSGQQGQQAPRQSADGQAPSDGQQPADGQQPPKTDDRMIDFDAMVTSGVISQETRDAIKAYMDEHRPEGAPAEGQAPTDGQQPPEKPSDDQAPADGQQPPEKPADGQMPDLLSDLLSAGVITQAEYEALTAAQTAA